MLYTHITPKVLVMSHTLKVIWSLYKKTCILYTHITPKVFVIIVVNHIHHCSIMIYKFANVSNYIVVRTFECVDYNFAWLSVYVFNFHYILFPLDFIVLLIDFLISFHFPWNYSISIWWSQIDICFLDVGSSHLFLCKVDFPLFKKKCLFSMN